MPRVNVVGHLSGLHSKQRSRWYRYQVRRRRTTDTLSHRPSLKSFPADLTLDIGADKCRLTF